MGPIFNEKIAEKCNLWDPWTCQQLQAEPKKKKREREKWKTQNANTKLIWIQMGTEYDQSELNGSNKTEVDQSGQTGLNRANVDWMDQIWPKWIE